MFRPLIVSASMLLVLTAGCSKPEFQFTLSSFSNYAQSLPEVPEPDNIDLLNPDFSSFYKKQKQSFFSRSLAQMLSLVGVPQPKSFEEIFLDTLNHRLKVRDPAIFKNEHVLVVKPGKGAHFFVWGDLQGAFHSLVRDLEELKKREIINDNLKIVKEKTYFVFNGNQIDRSPHNLQVLTLIMALLNQNEDRVIYIAGKHELQDHWRDFSTWRQLWSAFCDDLDLDCTKQGNGIPKGADLLTTFFRSLPLNLYVLDSSEKAGALKFYAHDNIVDDSEFANYLVSNKSYSENPTRLFLEEDRFARRRTLKLDAIIRATNRSISYRASSGLEMVQPEDGAITWTSLSSPVLANQRLFKFENDAFLRVDLNSQINNSTVTLFSQNSITRKGFETSTLHLLSGKELTKEEVSNPPTLIDYHVPFGSTFDLSGVASTLGQRIMSGVDLRIRKKNRNDEKQDMKRSDFENKILRFYISDDRSRPDLAQKNVEELMEKQNVHSLIMPAGIGTIDALTPKIIDGSLSIFFPNSGVSALRKPELKNLINLRTSFTNETCALVRYAKEALKKNKFAIAYQNDSFGKEAMAAAVKLLKEKYNANEKEDICSVSYEPDSLELDKPAEKLKECHPNALMLLATYSAAAALIKKLGKEALSEVSILGLSHISDALKGEADLSSITEKRSGLNIVISRVVPNPDDKSLLIVRRYRQQMDREYKGAKYNADSFEAYVGTSLLLRTMEGMEAPTREKLISKFETLVNESHQGIDLRFNKDTRELLDELWLDTGRKRWLNLKSANTLCDSSRDTQKSWK